MIRWKKSYELGIGVIDKQHKKLFELAEEANEMLELPGQMDKYDDIIKIIKELKSYVKYHFEEEEKILYRIRYNKFFQHKIRHNDFIKDINNINIDDIDYNQNGELEKILDVLMRWLVIHVLEEDRAWAEYYKEVLKINK